MKRVLVLLVAGTVLTGAAAAYAASARPANATGSGKPEPTTGASKTGAFY